MLNAALAVAERLLEVGVNAGDVCAIILRHNQNFYPIYMGISAIAALPTVLAYPNDRLHPDKFAQGLKGMSQRSGLNWILTEKDLSEIISPLAMAAGSSIRGILYPYDWDCTRTAPASVKEAARRKRGVLASSSPFLLQHSSGTTGLQKPVVLTHKAVIEHVKNYARSIKLSAKDRVVSWLPLYHDMGLIAAFHLPLAWGIPSVQIDPFEWITAPFIFMEALIREKGSVAWLPNFAYNLLAARVSEEEAAGLDLSRVRMFVNCSEPVRAQSHSRFCARFSHANFHRESLSACYAMAEATFAVTQTVPGREPCRLAADAGALKEGLYQPLQGNGRVRTCVSSGAPINGCKVKIIGENGANLDDGRVGEIAVQSSSMFTGYRNYPEKTAEALRNGWYHSGDLGFFWDGELYVIGRKKDVIIVAGKNIYPEDIEDAIGQVAGISPGRVVAFGLESLEQGTERVCVAAETSLNNGEDRKQLIMAVKKAAMAVDVTLAKVYLLPPRWLIKSSSGKPSRNANRERLLSGEGIYDIGETWTGNSKDS